MIEVELTHPGAQCNLLYLSRSYMSSSINITA